MKTIFLILFSVSLFGCYEQTVENKIVAHIENNCKQLPCVVRIREITDFDWDKTYVFDEGADIGEIEKVVGTYIPERTRVTRKLVFTKDGKVVHYDELPTNIERIVDNQVGFDNAGNYSHKTYLVEDAVFEAQKYLQSDGTYYHLKQKDVSEKIEY